MRCLLPPGSGGSGRAAPSASPINRESRVPLVNCPACKLRRRSRPLAELRERRPGQRPLFGEREKRECRAQRGRGQLWSHPCAAIPAILGTLGSQEGSRAGLPQPGWAHSQERSVFAGTGGWKRRDVKEEGQRGRQAALLPAGMSETRLLLFVPVWDREHRDRGCG